MDRVNQEVEEIGRKRHVRKDIRKQKGCDGWRRGRIVTFCIALTPKA